MKRLQEVTAAVAPQQEVYVVLYTPAQIRMYEMCCGV